MKLQDVFFRIVGLLRLVLVFGIFSCTPEEKEDGSISGIEKYREIRQEFLNKARPVIDNNDGGDAYLYPSDRNFSLSDFLGYRTQGLVGSDVSTISYCSITSSFGQFTHRTNVGEFLTLTHQRPGKRNVVPEFVKLGTDPLEVTGKYAHENGFEFFWSNRVNDTHDYEHRPDNPYERWSKLKTAHPEYLFGSPGEKLPHGRWSAVDFNQPEIRNLCIQYYKEVCENYDVDGIEVDFFRHLYLFKEVARGATATAAQLDMLTDMLRQIREMTERVGMEKGKPILILVRIPDSIDYCREIGIDIENWLRKRLVDIIVGSDYFRLNFWEYFVTLGHRYGVKVYAGLSESRINKEHPLLVRQHDPVYRARASAAWHAGVDGLYIFNEYDTRSRYLREIGSADKLRNKNNLYFLTYLNANPNSYLKNGNAHWNLPKLTPSNPVALDSKPLKFLLETGDESLSARTALLLYSRGNNPESVEAELNGIALNYLKSTDDGLSVFEVPQGTVKSGKNELELKCASEQEGLTLLDVAILFYRDADDPEIKELSALF